MKRANHIIITLDVHVNEEYSTAAKILSNETDKLAGLLAIKISQFMALKNNNRSIPFTLRLRCD